MEHFTHEMMGYEEIPAYVAVRKFFDCYLIERNYEKISSFLEEDFYCVGVSGDAVSVNKEKFVELIRGELEVISKPIAYKMQAVFGKEIIENIWNVLTTIKVMLSDDEEEKTTYELSLTICFKLSETGFVVTSMHMTKNNDIIEAQKTQPINNVKNKNLNSKEQTEQTVFENLDLNIYKGDFTIIMGSSGAGKSTLMYSLSGMDRPTSGEVLFNSKKITSLNDDKLAVFRRKNCGFVFSRFTCSTK
jgi:ABC-type glutathione transport system ATPase component